MPVCVFNFNSEGEDRRQQKLAIDINYVLIKADGQNDISDGERVCVMNLFQYFFVLFMQLK